MGKARLGTQALAAAAVVATAVVPGAFARTGTTSPAVLVNIHVTLTDSKVIVSPKEAPRGANARFVITNVGKKQHSFTFSFGSNRGFTRTFAPQQHKILVLYLDVRGIYNYYGGSTAGSSKPGMRGTFVVGAPCNACISEG